MKKLLVAALLATSAVFSSPVAGQEEAVDAGAEAREIWLAAAAKLEGAATLSATASLNYDVVQASGRKLQFGAQYEIKAKRPNKFAVDIIGDDGRRRSLYYNGEGITLVNLDEKLYATFEHQGSIESAIDEVLNTLNARMPLAALFRSNLRTILSGVFSENAYIGRHLVNSIASDHVLLSNEYLDLQLWVDAGDDAQLRKALVTYTDLEAEPQFEASFGNWRFNERIRDREFTFTPDEGFEQIEFLEAQN